MTKKRPGRIPSFYGLRIYLAANILFMFLVFPITGVLLIKHAPDLQKYRTGDYSFIMPDSIRISPDTIAMSYKKVQDSTANETDTTGSNLLTKADTTGIQKDAHISKLNESDRMSIHFTRVSSLWSRLILISFFLGFAFNLPFKIYLRKKRKRKIPGERLRKFCKKFILKTPLINAGILFIAYGITSGFMLYTLLFHHEFNEITRMFYRQFFFIVVVSSLLTLLFVYFWQRHRVQIRYIEHFFSPEELRKRIFNLKVGRIRNRLWISSAMTTFLPLLIVAAMTVMW